MFDERLFRLGVVFEPTARIERLNERANELKIEIIYKTHKAGHIHIHTHTHTQCSSIDNDIQCLARFSRESGSEEQDDDEEEEGEEEGW